MSQLKPSQALQNSDIPSNAVQNGTVIKNPEKKYELQIVWRNVILFIYFHIAALYGVYLMFTSAKLATIIFSKTFFESSVNLLS